MTLLIVPGADRVLVDLDGEAPHDAAAAAVEAAVAGLVAALA